MMQVTRFLAVVSWVFFISVVISVLIVSCEGDRNLVEQGHWEPEQRSKDYESFKAESNACTFDMPGKIVGVACSANYRCFICSRQRTLVKCKQFDPLDCEEVK